MRKEGEEGMRHRYRSVMISLVPIAYVSVC
jgi:hypothetical protein